MTGKIHTLQLTTTEVNKVISALWKSKFDEDTTLEDAVVIQELEDKILGQIVGVREENECN